MWFSHQQRLTLPCHFLFAQALFLEVSYHGAPLQKSKWKIPTVSLHVISEQATYKPLMTLVQQETCFIKDQSQMKLIVQVVVRSLTPVTTENQVYTINSSLKRFFQKEHTFTMFQFVSQLAKVYRPLTTKVTYHHQMSQKLHFVLSPMTLKSQERNQFLKPKQQVVVTLSSMM